ncbi:sensor domain-containing diguanylate cyclase [Humisphaera borealis]|uniref:diguanylate cyclase n=1 Tax=Humisphaera borealis TaxID=2807512 RepID=A0A7M2WTZ4_9BACT|nr:GGDEF domain-containing protein [Humisphaera borealis]QOV88923.1 GGDEF domain-containing protein [Humisphaera borealis]
MARADRERSICSTNDHGQASTPAHGTRNQSVVLHYMPSVRENILLIGDAGEQLRTAIAAVLPDADVTSVPTVFDGIAELSAGQTSGGALSGGISSVGRFTTVLAAAEPIERRPEAAVGTLRDLAGNGRLVLFGQPTLEGLSRKMLAFGCDDYLVTPASDREIEEVFATPNPHLPPEPAAAAVAPDAVPAATAPVRSNDQAVAEKLVSHEGRIDYAVLGSVLLDALIHHPHNPIDWTLKLISRRLSPLVELTYRANNEPPAARAEFSEVLSRQVMTPDGPGGTLFAAINHNADETVAREILQDLAPMIGRVAALQIRHAALQKMAITDELTGVYNARYFRHFLTRILEKARQMHFPVTLLLFDIDDFKNYNDQFGHQVGDEILKQTASMMRKSVREHDLVARIGGDEFAVVFWDKEGPRTPREPRPGVVSRPPHSPVQVFERFKRLIQSDEFTALGQHGRGKLGISAGLAVYPYEGHDVPTLIAEADKALMQGAKKHGKNRLSLVGNGNGGNGGNGGH